MITLNKFFLRQNRTNSIHLQSCLITRRFHDQYDQLDSQDDPKAKYYQSLKMLQVEPHWPLPRIKEQFINLTKKYHPDAPGGSTQKFIQIKDAFELVE